MTTAREALALLRASKPLVHTLCTRHPGLPARPAPSAGMRNTQTHGYVDRDLELIADAAARVKVDYREYVTAFARWIEAD